MKIRDVLITLGLVFVCVALFFIPAFNAALIPLIISAGVTAAFAPYLLIGALALVGSFLARLFILASKTKQSLHNTSIAQSGPHSSAKAIDPDLQNTLLGGGGGAKNPVVADDEARSVQVKALQAMVQHIQEAEKADKKCYGGDKTPLLLHNVMFAGPNVYFHDDSGHQLACAHKVNEILDGRYVIPVVGAWVANGKSCDFRDDRFEQTLRDAFGEEVLQIDHDNFFKWSQKRHRFRRFYGELSTRERYSRLGESEADIQAQVDRAIEAIKEEMKIDDIEAWRQECQKNEEARGDQVIKERFSDQVRLFQFDQAVMKFRQLTQTGSVALQQERALIEIVTHDIKADCHYEGAIEVIQKSPEGAHHAMDKGGCLDEYGKIPPDDAVALRACFEGRHLDVLSNDPGFFEGAPNDAIALDHERKTKGGICAQVYQKVIGRPITIDSCPSTVVHTQIALYELIFGRLPSDKFIAEYGKASITPEQRKYRLEQLAKAMGYDNVQDLKTIIDHMSPTANSSYSSL